MRKRYIALALSLMALPATAQEWPGTTIQSLAASLNCQAHSLTSSSQRAPMYGALPNWIVFNEGPSPVAVRGSGTRSRDIPVYAGKIISVHGELDELFTYTIGLSGAGSARVMVWRV